MRAHLLKSLPEPKAFFSFGGIGELMSRFSEPMHNRGVVNLGDSISAERNFEGTHASQSHPIEIYFDAQLLDIIGVSPRTVGFEELTTAVLALAA